MQQIKTRQISAWFLLSAALLQFALLVTSMITSFFIPVEHDMRPQWPSYLIPLVLLGITAVGAYQIRTQRETPPLSQRVGIPFGLSLGIVSAILLSTHGLGMTLAWATLGLPWLIGLLIISPATISSTSPIFALISASLYVVFAACYSTCAFLVTRRSGSVKQGIWSSVLAGMTTCLGTTLTFSLIDIAASSFFHTRSDLFAPSSFHDISPLVNYIVSYQGLVGLIAIWLLTPVILGLLITLVSSYISRHATFRFTRVQTDQAEPARG